MTLSPGTHIRDIKDFAKLFSDLQMCAMAGVCTSAHMLRHTHIHTHTHTYIHTHTHTHTN